MKEGTEAGIEIIIKASIVSTTLVTYLTTCGHVLRARSSKGMMLKQKEIFSSASLQSNILKLKLRNG